MYKKTIILSALSMLTIGTQALPALAKRTFASSMQLAQLNFYNGNLNAAIKNFLWAIQLNPKAYEPRLGLINVYVQDKKIDEAIDQCREAIKVKPNARDIHLVLANLLRTKEQNEEAAKEISAAEDCGADEAQCAQALALLYLQTGDHKKALTHADRLLDRKPKSADAHLLKSILLYKTGEKETALKELDTAISQKDKFPDAHTTKGDMLSADKKWNEAAAEYTKALAEDPRAIQAHVGLGNLYLQNGGSDGKGDLDKCIFHFSQARDLYPAGKADRNIFYGLALALERKGDSEGAYTAFNDGLLLETDPSARGQIQMHMQSLRKGKLFNIGAVGLDSAGSSFAGPNLDTMRFAPESPLLGESFANMIKVKQAKKEDKSKDKE
jgi:tetratricopeptide (TPR) repeat protein